MSLLFRKLPATQKQPTPVESWDSLITKETPPPQETVCRYTLNGQVVNKRKPTVQSINDDDNYGVPIYELLLEKTDKATKEPETAPKRRKVRHESRLLSEKHAPKSYWELSMTENFNIKVRVWLQKWMKRINEGLEEDSAPDHRPVLFVHGPPGSGKTTAIRVILEDLGFKRHEFDSGDGINGQFVDKTLKPTLGYSGVHSISTLLSGQPTENRKVKAYAGGRYAVETYTKPSGEEVVIRDDRPACVVIDGVDDAVGKDGRDFFRSFFKLLDGATDKNQRNKQKTPTKVLRPIIFIANQGRSPHLRELRQRSYIVEMTRQNPAVLREHLKNVCFDENLKLSSTEIEKLVERMGGDIRACLNSIQTYGTDQQMNSVIDTTIDPIGFGARLFHTSSAGSVTSTVERYGSNDLESLITTCFTQYVNTGSIMLRPWIIADWLQLADQAGKNSFWHGTAVEDYMRTTVFAFSQLFRATKKLPVVWPENNYETRMNTLNNVKRAMGRASAHVQSTYTNRTALMELYPFINCFSRIMSTNKDTVKDIGTSLLEAGIQIRGAPDIAGRMQYTLDPEIDESVGMIPHTAPSNACESIYESFKDAYRKNDQSRRQLTQAQSGGSRKTTETSSQVPKTTSFQQRHHFVTESKELVTTRDHTIWLDFKLADENAARRPIGWLDIFV